MLFPAPLGPTMAVVVPAGAWNDTLRSTGTPGVYSNETASNATSPAHLVERRALVVTVVLAGDGLHVAQPIEIGEGLAHARRDLGEIAERRGEHERERDVAAEIAERHASVEDGAAAEHHHDGDDARRDHDREPAHHRRARRRPGQDAEQAMQPLREHELLASLRAVGLHDADAGERLRQATRDLGAKAAALAKERSHLAMREVEKEAGERGEREREQRDAPVDQEERDERHERRQDVARPARELPADEVLHRRRVVHHARHERARLVVVEMRRGETRDVRHDAPPPPEHDTLRGEPEHAREREHGQRLHDGRTDHGEPPAT